MLYPKPCILLGLDCPREGSLQTDRTFGITTTAKEERAFFCRNPQNIRKINVIIGAPKLSKEELECPVVVVVTNIGEMQLAVLIDRTLLGDIGFCFLLPRIGSEAIFGPGDGPTIGNK